MKKLLCLLFLFLISCTTSNEIKDIEVLTYFTNARAFKIYATTDKSGFTQTLFKTEESNQIDNCQTKIRKSLMDSIVNVCKNKNETDFIFKSLKHICYCGNWQSVSVTYENGDKLRFRFPFANDENKQFIPFQALLQQIQKDSLKAARINIGQLGKLIIKQEDLSDFTFGKDSIRNARYLKKKV